MCTIVDKINQIEQLLKHLPGRHPQQRHAGERGKIVGFGPAYDKVGTGTTHVDEGPSGWEAGAHDVTRRDTHVLLPVELLRSSRVDVVRRAGVASSRTFTERGRLIEDM